MPSYKLCDVRVNESGNLMPFGSYRFLFRGARVFRFLAYCGRRDVCRAFWGYQMTHFIYKGAHGLLFFSSNSQEYESTLFTSAQGQYGCRVCGKAGGRVPHTKHDGVHRVRGPSPSNRSGVKWRNVSTSFVE